MKRLIFALVLFTIGCSDYSSREIKVIYASRDDGLSMIVTHRAGHDSVSILLTTIDETKKYRERLQKVIKDLDNFEQELTIKEKK
jgi:hypothetical protein